MTSMRQRGGLETRPNTQRRGARALGLALAVALLLTFVGSSAAASVREADSLLSAWQMEEARRVIDELAKKRPESPEVLYLQARYDFFQGRYAEAVARLDQALARRPREDWKELREVIAATHEVTKDYERHVSPSGYFEVFIEKGKDVVLLPYAFEALDRAYEALGEELGYKPPTPIRIEVYPRTDTLAKVSVLTEEEIRTSGTIALCKYNRLMITSPKALMRGYGWVDTLVHEYVHYVINRKTENRVPIWMHEGLAKFLERRWRGPDAHRLPPSSEHLLQQRVKQKNLITFKQMHPSMAKLPSQEDASVAFAEVYTAMEYLREHGGEGAFRRMLDAISAGLEPSEAFASVLGVSFQQFERQWMRSLAQRKPIVFPDEGGFDDRLVFKDEKGPTELSQIPQPQARDHMHLGQMLEARGRFAAAVVEYQKAVRLMGDQNPVLQTRLAKSLLEIGKPAEALAALSTVRESYPSYVTTWIQLGRAARELSKFEDAREYLLEAARLNPFDPQVHSELAVVYEKLGDTKASAREREFVKLLQ